MEMKEIKEHLDLLTARSWAQETVLLLLFQKELSKNTFLDVEAGHFAQQVDEQLRHSPLSDSQLGRFRAELTALLARLHLPGGVEF